MIPTKTTREANFLKENNRLMYANSQFFRDDMLALGEIIMEIRELLCEIQRDQQKIKKRLLIK
jgi:hypothetical protein